jgi:hypothetical protein
VIRRTNPRKTNGHAGALGRPNGHDPASVERGGVPVAPRPGDSHLNHAASDDASGIPVACAPASSVASLPSQASTDREAYAAAAPPPTQSARRGSETGQAQGTGTDREKFPGGESPLPDIPGDFVEEIHRRADLFEVWQSLLNSEDEKVRQRAVEKLTEMRYKGADALADEPPRIVIDMPRPDRD